MNASNTFNRKYETITTVVAFDECWNNGTGYLDGCVKADIGLRPGDSAKGVTSNERKFIVVGTRFGNCVVFQRYTGGEGDVFVSNVPHKVGMLYRAFTSVGTALDSDGMAALIGHPGDLNVGARIESLFE